jgi:hypothetical protein
MLPFFGPFGVKVDGIINVEREEVAIVEHI